MKMRFNQTQFFCAFLLFLCQANDVIASELKLAVANSTCNVIKQVSSIYSKHRSSTNKPFKISTQCKSSGRLAKGIKGQAISADIYISANKEWMDYIVRHKIIDRSAVKSPWGNRLVVAAPVESQLNLTDWDELKGRGVKSVMIGDPGTAPFGRYAKQALRKSQIWEQVKKKIVTKKHITILAQSLADSSPKTVGILYLTNVTDELKVFDIVNEQWHQPIRYFVGPINHSPNHGEAQKFIQFLLSEPIRKIFAEHGFDIQSS